MGQWLFQALQHIAQTCSHWSACSTWTYWPPSQGRKSLGLGLGLWWGLGLGFKEPHTLSVQRHWDFKRHTKMSTALHKHCSLWMLLMRDTHGAGVTSLSIMVLKSLQLGLGFKEPQSLQVQRCWGCKRHTKMRMALHKPCVYKAFSSETLPALQTTASLLQCHRSYGYSYS